MVNFVPLTAEIGSGVWGTLPSFKEFRVLAALLHGTLVVGVSQTLRRCTEGATYIREGGHHVGHWPTFQLFLFFSPICSGRKVDVTSTHDVALEQKCNLECRSEMCCTLLAGNTGRKNDSNNRHLCTIGQFVGLYLRN